MPTLYHWLWPAMPAADQSAFVIDLAVKSSILLALALAMNACLQRASAAARELVWRGALLALLLLPGFLLLLPSWRLPVLAAELPPVGRLANRAAPVGAEERAAHPAHERHAATGLDPGAAARPEGRKEAPPASQDGGAVPWLLLFWGVGALLAALPLAAGLVRTFRLLKSGRPAGHHDAVRAALDALRETTPLPVFLRVREAGGVRVPMAWSVRAGHPCTILLPLAARTWSVDRLHAALAHEVAHVRRRDCPAQVAARLAAALCWFHPLAWWGLRRMRREAECACDDAVLRGGVRPSDYAGHLLDITLHASGRSRTLAGVSMARGAGVQRRLTALLDARRRRRTPSPVSARLILGLMVALAGPLAMIRGVVHLRLPERQVKGGPEQEKDEGRLAAGRGLAWLAACQDAESGSWRADVGYKFNNHYEVIGSDRPHVGVTALVLRAFVRAGHLPGKGAYGKNVARAVSFLLSCFEPKTGFINEHGSRMRSHALALMTLAEIARIEGDVELKERLRPSVDFLVAHQNPAGGWRYQPVTIDVDVLHVALCLRALRKARATGLEVPATSILRAEKLLGRMARREPGREGFAYQPTKTARVTYGCTAAGLEAWLDTPERDPLFVAALLDRLDAFRHGFEPAERGLFFWHALQHHAGALHRLSSTGSASAARWRHLRQAIVRQLLPLQRPDGSWPCARGPGPVYSTAIACDVLLLDTR